MLDGARNALLGFLYQLLGTAVVRVREVASLDDAWADLIARVDSGDVRCEEFGQDATIRPSYLPDQGVVAIQFKYSAKPGNVIERGDLIDILIAFDRSRMQAANEDVRIERYVLITNRALHANAQKLIDEGKTSADPPSPLRLQLTKAGMQIAENVKRVELYGGDRDAAAKAWHAVLQAVAVPQGETFEGDLYRLQKFAARYGVLDHELNDRLNALVGAFIRETAMGATIDVTLSWLKRHLVGDPDAANLQFSSSYEPHISTKCRELLCERLKQHRIPDRYYVPRDVEERIRDQLASHPIVFVYGNGGCGKSLAAVQYLRSNCHRRLVWSEPATTATEESIVGAVNRVRLPGGLGGCIDRSLNDVRARLSVANPGERQVWTIDLDGIDETPICPPDLFRLISLCWAQGNMEASPASLVITCRSPAAGWRDPEDLVSKWLNYPDMDLARGVGFVNVGEFTDQDLIQAAQLLNRRPERQIINALEPGSVGSSSSLFVDSESIAPEILQALRHPVVWGGYASIEDENDRNGILQCDPNGLARLAEQLLRRFLNRCRRRRAWSDSRMLDQALNRAARFAIKPPSPPYAIQEWVKRCVPPLGETEALWLYNECLTYGLIQRDDAAGWRWRHQFVVDFLANQPDPRGT